ncbi:SWIB/MDM2 domain-containing protein [Aureococcus anophagefferens]|nr:SWIB/MDM2 domain-containing protein [Aureococcus anophagefferens]
MAAVVGVGRANHFRLVKLLWKYIKKHDLQNPANKNEIVCDAALKAAFKKDKVTSFGMSKLLSAHMHREHDSFLARAPVVDYAELADVDESDAEDVAGAVEDTPRTRRAFSELADYLAAKGLSRGVVTNWSVTTNQRGDAIFLDPAGRIFRSKAEVARFAKAAADAEDRAADDRRVEAARPPPVVEAAPPAADAEGLLFEGDAIEARCRGGAWYPGRVAFVHDGGGAIDVAYDDGDAGRAWRSCALRQARGGRASPARAPRRSRRAQRSRSTGTATTPSTRARWRQRGRVEVAYCDESGVAPARRQAPRGGRGARPGARGVPFRVIDELPAATCDAETSRAPENGADQRRRRADAARRRGAGPPAAPVHVLLAAPAPAASPGSPAPPGRKRDAPTHCDDSSSSEAEEHGAAEALKEQLLAVDRGAGRAAAAAAASRAPGRAAARGRAAAPRPLLVAAEAELHGGTAEEEQAAPRFCVPQFLGSKDVAGARRVGPVL